MKSKKAMSLALPALLGLAGAAAAQTVVAVLPQVPLLPHCTLPMPWPGPLPKPYPVPACDPRYCDPATGEPVKGAPKPPQKPRVETQSLTRASDLLGDDAGKAAEILDALFTGAKSAFVKSAPIRSGKPVFQPVKYDDCFDNGKDCKTITFPPRPQPAPRPAPAPAPQPQPNPAPLPPSPIPGTTRPA